MKTLKEILEQEKNILFKVEECDKEDFLKFAKANGCKWINGSEIEIRKEDCSTFMGIGSDLALGRVSAMCWAYSKGKTKMLEYSKVKENIWKR